MYPLKDKAQNDIETNNRIAPLKWAILVFDGNQLLMQVCQTGVLQLTFGMQICGRIYVKIAGICKVLSSRVPFMITLARWVTLWML